ncbi:hypothetical protein PAT3040_03816 [Paenibacillus agaridevorans]|uniref:Uncharacterized protein n=1 Tax=Paenibacillus agaridevorans TaxID=171404 RepID=A0A2R5ER70_9BACL|nr:hypothetical protein PAT3040_03816 [Paenibacillus agaridevorans]
MPSLRQQDVSESLFGFEQIDEILKGADSRGRANVYEKASSFGARAGRDERMCMKKRVHWGAGSPGRANVYEKASSLGR